MASEGDFPFRSAWLGRGRGRGRGAQARPIVNTAANTANDAYRDVWADWLFDSAGPAAQDLQPSLVTNSQTFYAPTMGTGTTETITIADSADDAASVDNGDTINFYDFAIATGLDVASDVYAGARFPAVDIGAGSTITTASLIVKTRAVGVTGTTWGSWFGDDVDDAPAWSSSSRPDQITKTTASTVALCNPTDATDNVHDVTAIVQEIIDRAGWVSGNAIRFGADPTGADGLALYYDYTDNPAYAAVLSIDYVSVLELTPSLVTNSQTFHAAAVSPTYTMTAGLHTNSQTFYGPTISQTGGTQDLTPSLFTNSNSFFAATVSAAYALAPALTENGQTFYAATVSPGAVTIAPPLVTNAQTFYDQALTATVSLSPSLFINEQTFYAPTVAASYTLSPALFENGQTFPTATVSTATAIDAGLFTNTQGFFGPIVTQDGGPQFVNPSLVENVQQFFGPTVEQAGGLPQGGSAKKRQRISYNPQTVDLYELFRVEQNNVAIIAALETI